MVPGTPVVCTVMYWELDEKPDGVGEGAKATNAAHSHDTFLSMLERCVLIVSSLSAKVIPS